ncbi:bifunctional nitrate reductase/sulfite reductase flavoprotein subunit alpha [Sanguibacter massiliensis]|uniref:bifunctional nitrate reductase/sulfite reductase flavoprotein subunit alpha n=1 Tax=Sanguibacter massiliensis TaxID=1973217 RepID=UPI001F5DC25B|nr:bifunctional nitrate reductase/sulfite reductase flavoprotein subunit alpha [Sanguibacter massiliensis]
MTATTTTAAGALDPGAVVRAEPGSSGPVEGFAPAGPGTVRTVCGYCGVGCGIALDVVRHEDGACTATASRGDAEHPANRGRLCTKGATTVDVLGAGGRATSALVRAERGGDLAPAPLAETIGSIAARFTEIIAEHGPDAVALYVSGQMSIEAQYLSNKLAKGAMRTRWIESNSRLCMASAGTGYKLSLGSDAPPGSYDDLDEADLFVIIGANMADCHPILFLRMLDRVRAGAKLVVIDPRRTATADKADLHLAVRPGTDVALLNGLARLVVEAGGLDEDFLAEHTEGWDELEAMLGDYPADEVERLTGVPEAQLREVADLVVAAGGRWVSCWTMGLNQSVHGTWSTNALINLHLLTGAICRPGAGPFSLTGQPNAMGGREMGYMGPGLPGQRSVLSDDDRAFVEERWGLAPGTIRAESSGRGTVEMFERLADGDVRAVWIICTNPAASMGNRDTVLRGLAQAELVVVQDAFADTDTTRHADVVLPAATWAESDGVMVNSERNATLARGAVPPPGDALPDWQLVSMVARAMGYAGFDHASASEVFEEIRQFTNPATGYDLRGITHDRLREGPVQWPAAPDGPRRNPVRYLNDGVHSPVLVHADGTQPRLRFATASGRARLWARPHMPAAELPDDDFPFLLTTGRVQHQWHTMTKTGKVAKLNRLAPAPFCEINPEDAERLGVRAGDGLEIVSRRGRAVLPATVTDRVPPGCLFAPIHWNDLAGPGLSINSVTNDAVDPLSFQPELKISAVTLTVVPAPVPDEPEVAAPAMGGGLGAAGGLGSPGALGALGDALGLGPIGAPPELDDTGRRYLAGFLAGLGTGAAAPGTPVLPASAPLTAEQAEWVDGMLAGAFSRAGSGIVVREAGPTVREVVVLWSSQTGTAEELAARVAAHLTSAGTAARLLGTSATSPGDLPRDADIIMVSSTFGDGDAPDDGVDFWESLVDPGARRLEGSRFAVLALGDASFERFCGHGRRLDHRLAELGAQRLVPRADTEAGDDDRVDAWLAELTAALTAGDPVGDTVTPGAGPADDDAPSSGTPSSGTASSGAAASSGTTTTSPREPEIPTGPPVATRKEPGEAVLVEARLLSGEGSAKEVRHVVLDVSGSGRAVTYRAGDALAVHPTNAAALVAEWCDVTGWDPAATVALDGADVVLGDALAHRLDLTRTTSDLLTLVAERSGDDGLRRLLRRDNRDDLARWTWCRQPVDVLAELAPHLPAADVLATLRPLAPRQYSISSTPLVSPGQVSLTMSVVRYTSPAGAARGGLCSTFLADAAPGTLVPVHVQPTERFRPPAPDARAIMVGPGTGVAPFLGFLDERRAAGHTGASWLFFGEQHEATDFYHADRMREMLADGTLTRLDTAFSRDQRTKVYVQDRMREHGARLWSWLEDGASFFVCGDASRMAKDVDQALRDVVATHGRMPPDDAAAYVRRLTAARRYVRDVY